MLIPQELKTFFYLPPIDFRKSIDGLSIIITQEMKISFSNGHIFYLEIRVAIKSKLCIIHITAFL